MKTMLIPAAYTDGSYNPTTGYMGCAFVMIDQKHNRPYRISFKKHLTAYKEFGSNIAEICAARSLIKAAISLGLSKIRIYHDWNGVEIFSHSDSIKTRHKACPSFAEYAKYVEEARKKIVIIFVKVKAHSDDEMNCIVDKMARRITES